MKISSWELDDGISSQSHTSIVASVLNDRGYCDEKVRGQFLEPSLGNFHDPMQLKDMAIAHDLIANAISCGDKITVYGDYDVDGMTSTSILMRLFKSLGGNADYYIPSRFEEGYGLNADAVKQLAAEGTKLLITVDCGITSTEEAKLAKSLGMTLIITDHHHLGENIPDADAVINPKQTDCNYPYDMLAGAGIALKLAQTFIECKSDLFKQLTVLSAIGTVADIAPLINENRLITQFGIMWSKQSVVGLDALMNVAGIADKALTAGAIGFQIGPRLNAVGRLENAKLGVELLISDNPDRANEIANHLNKLNDARKASEKEILSQATAQIKIEPLCLSSGIVIVWGENWNEGVIGIVASRLKELYYRPAIVFSKNGDMLKGSARSIDDFSIFDALSSVKHLMTKFGGHSQAAGLSMPSDNLHQFISELTAYNAVNLTNKILTPKVKISHTLKSSDITHDAVCDLEKLAPFGVSNARPIFMFDNLNVGHAACIGKQKNVLKLKLSCEGKLFDAIKFSGQNVIPSSGTRMDVALNLDINHYRGIDSIQFNLKDYRSYDPAHNNFTKVWYTVYLMHLFKHFRAEAPSLVSKNRTPRKFKDGRSILKDGRTILVSSYEGLLELAYHAHDLNIELANLIDSGIVNIIGPQGRTIDVVYDTPFNPVNDFVLTYTREHDHSGLIKTLAEATIDRRTLAIHYKQVMNQTYQKLTKALLHADNPFITMLALNFFEEAEFIRIVDDVIILNPTEHKKTEYNFSATHKMIEALRLRLYTIFN